MLEKEDLVRVKGTVNIVLNGSIARVELYMPNSNQARIKLVQNKDGTYIDDRKFSVILDAKYLVKIPVEKDVTDLINLAIDTGDKEWFLQLTNNSKSMQGGIKEQ